MTKHFSKSEDRFARMIFINSMKYPNDMIYQKTLGFTKIDCKDFCIAVDYPIKREKRKSNLNAW